jgi:hypothetical protein
MTTEAQIAPNGADRRGTPPGKGMIVPEHGGRIGNPPFVPTEAQRAKARSLAKTFPITGERNIAVLIGISRDTLRKYFAEDLELGRAEMLAAVGGQMISRALDADAKDANGKPVAKGDLDAQKFVLARMGAWSTKVEHSGPEGGPIETVNFDLSALSIEQQEALIPVIDLLLHQAGVTIPGEFTELESEPRPEGEDERADDAG